MIGPTSSLRELARREYEEHNLGMLVGWEKEGMHPTLRLFLNDHSCEEAKAHLAFHVYQDLCEVRAWRNVGLHFNTSLDLPYITGRPSLSCPLEVVLPLSVESSVSHAYIQSLFECLHVEDHKCDRIIVAVCTSDSSIVYYKFSRDIVRPETPEVTEARRGEWAQKAAKRKSQLAESVAVFLTQAKSEKLDPR